MTLRYEELHKLFKNFVLTSSVTRPKTKFSLGPLSVNLAIGDVSGVDSGRFVQIFGKPSVGKSTLALDIVRQWQERDELNDALYVDYERALDQDYANTIVADPNRLYIVRADTTEQGQDIIEAAIDSGVKLIVIDSIAAGMPSNELEKDNQQNPKMASNAGLWTRFTSRIIGKIDNSDTMIILLNQMRKNFSTMSREEEIPWGGLALQFATSVSIALSRIKTEDNRITVQALIKKNKVGNPQQRAEFFIEFGKGIRHDMDVITLAINAGIVTKSGTWYYYKDNKAQGVQGAAELFPLDEIRTLLTKETP